MKQHLFVLLFTAVLACGCSKEILTDKPIGDIDLKPSEITETTIADLDEGVFELLNLDYPGLEKVKTYYENGKLGNAARAMLEYWRTRSV